MRSLFNNAKMFLSELYNYNVMIKALKKDIKDTM